MQQKALLQAPLLVEKDALCSSALSDQEVLCPVDTAANV